MKAIVFKQYGLTDVLDLQEVEKPSPKDGELLIKICASSVNSWDWELLRGTPFANRLAFGIFKPKKINILGCDVAGRVEAVGKGVKQFKIGDPVFGDLSHGKWGGFAEYVCADEKLLAMKSDCMTFKEAAAVPQAAVLALQGLRKGKIQQNHKVLINGAGGGVGSYAVQIAKYFGAEVTGVDSTSKLDMMRSVGADHVIDYTNEDFTTNGQHYDLILDIMAHHSIFDCKRALSSKGIYVFVGGATAQAFEIIFLGPLISLLGSKKMSLLLHKPNPKDLNFITGLFQAGKIVSIIDKEYPLSRTHEAIARLGAGEAIGKIVITMGDKVQ